jgi:hypothetical protein
MNRQAPLVIGTALVLFGLVWLTSELLHINFWVICWPTVLILMGLWMLLRAFGVLPGALANFNPLADIRRKGAWNVANEEIWTFVGDTRLDMTEADIPVGETTLRVYGFVGNVRLIIPPGVGISVSSNGFLSTTHILGKKDDTFFMPFEFSSDNYATAERKIRLEAGFFVGEIRVNLSQPEA